jgi:hypothetical protein
MGPKIVGFEVKSSFVHDESTAANPLTQFGTMFAYTDAV